MCPIHPIVDLRAFFDVLIVLIICWILADPTMNLRLRRVTVSVLKFNCHPRVIFVSDNPSSAANLSFATIGTQWMGSFLSFGRAATLIASGIAASSQFRFCVPGKWTVNLVMSWCKHLRILDGQWRCPQLISAQLQKLLHLPNIPVLGSVFELMNVMCLDPNLCIATARLQNCKLFW